MVVRATRFLFALAAITWAVFGSGHAARAQAVVAEPTKAPAPTAAVAPQTHGLEHPDGPVIDLDALLVGTTAEDDGYDATGMGAQQAELREPPFSNDIIAAGNEESEAAAELNIELGAIASVSPADLVAGLNRLNLRGFPTPRLRNGFIQTGVPEILNTAGNDRIQGPLTPVTGKAAPGGIENIATYRPKAAPLSRISLFASSARERSVAYEYNAPIVPKKSWQRWSASWRNKDGPEAFSYNRSRTLSGGITLKHTRNISTLLMADYADIYANPGSGIPEYRLTRTGKVVGPYLPLAYLHNNGPESRIRKQVASVSAQTEAQIGRRLSLRAGVQWFWRGLIDERFTKGEYVLDEGVFAGIREPQYIEQPLEALNGGVEAVLRYYAFKADHKLLFSLERSFVDSSRLQKGLDTAERNALPATVRSFNPFAPDYFRPELTPTSYRRLITDRSDVITYSSAVLSERMALHQGRTVLTAGLRQDWVDLEITDRRPSIASPFIKDDTEQLTWLGGINYQLHPGKTLLFANASSAFEPSTRIDARTGRVQGNETTRGYEGGLKGLLLHQQLTTTILGFVYYNENISRRNPLYDDPIFDANQTQPQLVAAGVEKFTGGSIDLRYVLDAHWTFTSRGTYTRAITTASPDLPQEVGRILSRMPDTTLAVSARYGFSTGRLKGASLVSTMTYVGDYVAYYPDRNREFLAYPSYTLYTFSASYGWLQGKKHKIRHSIGASVRNLFDRDLLIEQARPGQGRTLTGNYSVTF